MQIQIDENIEKTIQEMGITEEDLQDPKKVEELAKKVEQENKEIKQNSNTEETKGDETKEKQVLQDKLN